MNEAYKKFVTGNTIGQREYRTIEIYHSQFSQTFYFVKDYENQFLEIESTAIRNQGEIVEFEALSMNLIEPSENLDAEQVLTVQLGAIGSLVNKEIEKISGDGFFEPIQFIYRKYYSGSVGEPVLILNLTCSNITFNSYENLTLTCEDLDINNKSSGELYTLERFEGLRGL